VNRIPPAVGKEQPSGLPVEAVLARGALVLLACTLIYLLLGLAIYRFWHPSGSFYHDLYATTILDTRVILPEPQEQRLFMLVVFSLPFLILALWRGVAVNRIARLTDHYAPVIVAVATALVVALAIAGLAVDNHWPEPLNNAAGEKFARASRTNAGFYLYSTLVYDHPYFYACMLFPGALWLLLNQRVQRFLYDRERWVTAAVLLFAAVLGLWLLASETFRFPYTTENRYDFSPIYYPMVQVYYGAQLLTEHFIDTYGLYPQLLLPVFKIIGLSIQTFSGTMAVLTVVCFGILLLALWRFIDNPLLRLWTFAAVVFYVFCYSRTINPFDPYFANIPIRLITTMTALGLALWYRRDTGRLATIAALALLAAGILWCPDFGLISYFAFTLFLGYLRVDLQQLRRTALALGEVVALSLGTLSGVFCGYVLLIRLFYGMMPDLALLFSSMKAFSALGMNMLPMPLCHPWNLVVLTFAGGLLATLPMLWNGTQDERSGRLFLLTLLGVGAFSYYQGRSHNWNLLPILFYVLPLWGIFADWLLARVGEARRLLFPLAVLVLVLGTALPQLAYAWRPLMNLIEESEDKAANLVVERQIESGAEFIRNRTLPGEKVLLYTEPARQALYHGLAQRGSAFNPDYMTLVWREDYRRFLTFLYNNTTVKIYYDNGSRSPFMRNVSKPVKVLLNCCYKQIDANGPMLELGKLDSAVACNRCLQSEDFDFSQLQLSRE